MSLEKKTNIFSRILNIFFLPFHTYQIQLIFLVTSQVPVSIVYVNINLIVIDN